MRRPKAVVSSETGGTDVAKKLRYDLARARERARKEDELLGEKLRANGQVDRPVGHKRQVVRVHPNSVAARKWGRTWWTTQP